MIDVGRRKATKNKGKVWHAVPLKGSFMVLSIVGFFISAYMIYPVSTNFGVASMLVFAAMFVASLVSVSKAPVAV